jgi:TniQ
LTALYETRGLFDQQIPVRSALYSLSPLGILTRRVERLTGYFSRLAHEHRLSVTDLTESELFAAVQPAIGDRRIKRRLFQASCHLLDGSDGYTQKWVDALEAATLQKDLRSLTLYPYLQVCEGSWLRRKRVWCPQCYEDSLLAEQTIYDPLIWAIRTVSICPTHRLPLVELCPHCHRAAPPLAGATSPGHCGYCLGWLGTGTSVRSGSSRSPLPDEYQLWCADQTGLLIEAGSQFATPLDRDTIGHALSCYFRRRPPASLSALEQSTRCTRRSIATWTEGATLPRVESLFRLCFDLRIAPVELLESASSQARIPASRGVLIELRRNRVRSPVKEYKSRRHSDIRRALKAALRKSLPPTLHDVAVGLKLSSSTPLRGCEANLCDRLLAKREKCRRANEEQAKVILEQAIRQSDMPPFAKFCKQNGISIEMINARYPGTKKKYDEHFHQQRVCGRRKRGEHFDLEVKRVVDLLETHAEYPSVGRVLSVNPILRSGGWAELSRAIHASGNRKAPRATPDGVIAGRSNG